APAAEGPAGTPVWRSVVSLADPTVDLPRTRSERVRARRVGLPRRESSRRRHPEPGRKSRPRRLWELAWPLEVGARLRLPALPAMRTGARLLSLGLVVATVWTLGSAFRSADFQVAEAEVGETQLFDADRVRSIAGVDGMMVFLVDAREVETRLMQQPEIQQAEVSVRWPNRVAIDIVERQPMVEWNDGGRVWWLSDDGIAFLQHGEREGLVRVETKQPVLDIQPDPLAPAIEPEILWAAAALKLQVPEAEVLRFDAEHGLGFEDPLGWTVYFGHSGDMVLKVKLYRTIAQGLQAKGVEAEWVSVEDPATPYYRVKRD
ncbi:MAG TPA: FtsQ-type POTRA domain-containing protein, partial [Anaerolineales bacterium]|nr:FtsQ-type POTRA domain-containing protein [Anaerolineales bacterium]